jgi:hypothetical protein
MPPWTGTFQAQLNQLRLLFFGDPIAAPSKTKRRLSFPRRRLSAGTAVPNYCFGAVVAPVVPVVELLALLSPSSSNAGAA